MENLLCSRFSFWRDSTFKKNVLTKNMRRARRKPVRVEIYLTDVSEKLFKPDMTEGYTREID